MRQHRRADLGQPDRTSRAIQQWMPQFPFQPADLRAHSGLGDVHPGGGPGEIGLLGHRDKIFQLT